MDPSSPAVSRPWPTGGRRGYARDWLENLPYREFDDILPGDWVYLGPRRQLRRVRSVRYYDKTDHVRLIEVVKIRRSGYQSPTTYIDRSAMYEGAGYQWGGFVKKGGPLCSTDLECELQRQVEQRRHPRRLGDGRLEPGLTENDVVGILR